MIRFVLVYIASFNQILISLKDKLSYIFKQTIFYTRISIEYLIGFVINVINDFVDEFIEILKTFKNRFGFGFYGISYYFIIGIFYLRKFLRKALKILKKLARLNTRIRIFDTDININIYSHIRSIKKIYRQKKKEASPYRHIINRARAIRGIIKSEKPPVILSFIGSTNILTTIACKFLGKKVVISERNDPAIQRLNHPYERLRPLIYKHATVVTANTKTALDTMKQYVPDYKLQYIPNPLDLNVSNNGARKRRSYMYILSVGRLHEQKAYDVLLKSFKVISPKLENWRLVILGKGELKKDLHRLAEDLGISHLVEWKGHESNPYKFYRDAELYVLPSRHEGMSNSLLEAMSFGLPSIVSDACEGSLELIHDNVNGLVIPVDDHIALSDAILRLASDEKLRFRLGQEARKAIKKFELPIVLNEWENLLGL
jgi:glycosyltransferase involved in cell wall biosynthesis